jgi:hypothetical protein
VKAVLTKIATVEYAYEYEEGKRNLNKVPHHRFRIDILTVPVGSIDEFGLNTIVSTAHVEAYQDLVSVTGSS